MGFDTLLTISITLEDKAELSAISKALGMSGMGAVVRAMIDGRLPPISVVPEQFNSYQIAVYNRVKREYLEGEK